MERDKIINILKNTDAFLTGHFVLASGNHSENYIQCAKLFEYPNIAKDIALELGKKWKKKKIALVIGPAMGAVILSFELAKVLNARSIFAERKNGVMMLRRNFHIKKDENVLVCEDVVTTGGSVKEVIDLVKSRGGNILGVTSIIKRCKENPFENYEYKSLITLDFPVYKPSECPLCKKGVPIKAPGTKIK
jgi:orotate phosphoribosyltransferase